jgi:hypothetical protein
MMPIRLTSLPTDEGVKLATPVGRHLKSADWWVEAGEHPDALLLAVWSMASKGVTVIAVDPNGSERGSMLTRTYDEAKNALGFAGSTKPLEPDGRRIVTSGNRNFELGAEIHSVADEELLYLRIWLQRRQRFVLYVIDREGVILDRATGDYAQAKQRVLSHLLA